MLRVTPAILSQVSVTVLCENTARRSGVVGEHGLSWWIEAGEKRVLFDLGQGLGLVNNAARLGVDLCRVDAIALSHGHYDHVGGWHELPLAARRALVFYHPDAFAPKYQKRQDGRIDPVGDRAAVEALMAEAGDLVPSSEPVEVVPGVWLSGEVPRTTSYEDTGGVFCCDEEGEVVDPIRDDQSLFFDTEQGLVVILGCAHAGVVNTLRYLRDLTLRPIHAVLGGMHLVNAGPERVRRTVEDLKAIGPDWIGANHCTGSLARARLQLAFEDRFLECGAGDRIRFPIS